MKQLHLFRQVLLALALSLPLALSAQPANVERAYNALLQVSDAPSMRWTSYVDAITGARSKHANFGFQIPVAKRSLIDDFYSAFEADKHLCTQYERDDAHSAHTWAVPVQVPGTTYQATVDATTNYLQGGFIDSSTTPTSYHYYVLTWKTSPDGQTLFGRAHVFSIDATTQHPAIRQPATPSYSELLTAIDDFTSCPQNNVSRSFHWSRAAATGQWIRRYNTWGFNFPLDRENELLSPLYRAFEAQRTRAYRFLNKPSGQAAENVSIIVDNQGGNLGLGSQTDWNIIYAYFTDEDFPDNRYVYALWYKADVPRQRIVGELFEINTERPNGGVINNPFIQRSVPDYLWHIDESTQGGTATLAENRIEPVLSETIIGSNGEQLILSYKGAADYNVSSPELSALRDVLSPSEHIAYTQGASSVTSQVDCGAGLRGRGMDLDELSRELDDQARSFETERSLYVQTMSTYAEMFNETNTTHKQELQEQTNKATLEREQALDKLMESRKKLSKADYDHQLADINERYATTLRQISSEYSKALQTSNADYAQELRQLSEEYNGRMSFFGKDGTPAQFIHRVFDHLITAYHADGTLLDAAVAKKMSTLVKLMGEFSNAETKAFYLNRLKLLQDKRRGTLADSSLADAVVSLGGERGTPGITTAKQFNKQFNKHYSAALSAIKRYSRGKDANIHTVRYYLTQLSTFCCNSASLATNPSDYINRLNQLRAAFVDANTSYYTHHYVASVEDVTPIHTLFDQAIEAFSRHLLDILSLY